MNLVTGAAGKTGKAVIRALVEKGESVRALVHSDEQARAVMALGANETRIGDMERHKTWTEVVRGVRVVYHISPNMHPHEVVIGHFAIQEAKLAGVERFVYHSVLHPQVELMPHHWLKMRVEERLFESGLTFTILQPAPYMQNLLGSWKQIKEEGVYSLPYAVGTRVCMVDLVDVAEAAAKAMTEPGHEYAIYELIGEPASTQTMVAETISRELGKPVRVKQTPIGEWERGARAASLSEYAVSTLIKMFEYYERYGMEGNTNALSGLLGRTPTSLETFIRRIVRTA